ncbi:MAG: hypothetical protein ABSF09_08775 [Candidatus Bathyarchaeia archaeon]
MALVLPDIIGFLIHLVIEGVILGIFVWLAAKVLGAPKATYYHGILTVISAIILSDIIGYVVPWHTIALIVEVLVILLLIKHFFGVGWLRAVIIAVLAVIIGIIITTILAMILTMIGLASAAAALKGLAPGI